MNKYRVYCKYFGDYDLLSDHRSGDINDLKIITPDEWFVIEDLVDNFYCLQTNAYSNILEERMKKRIEELKSLVTLEVFNMIERKQKPEVLKRRSLLNSVKKYLKILMK